MTTFRRRIIQAVLFVAGLTSACEAQVSKFGVSRIEAPDGTMLFFRREVRGLNYDSLILSTESSPCTGFRSDSDVRFKGLGPIVVFYRFDGPTLHLYLSSAVAVPEAFHKKIRIQQHILSNPEYIFLKDHYRERSLEKISPSLDDAIKCDDRSLIAASRSMLPLYVVPDKEVRAIGRTLSSFVVSRSFGWNGRTECRPSRTHIRLGPPDRDRDSG